MFFVLILLICTNTYISGEISSQPVRLQQLLAHSDFDLQRRLNANEKVNIQLYYETFCLDCREFDSTKFKDVVLKLNKYLNITTYPYGNAQTTERNGKYYFECQHGPGECYGNKLHACALQIIKNQTEALLYNSCMMDGTQTDKGSDDHAADKCGSSMKIETDSIKTCAKGVKGTELLKYYGDESKKANFGYVPYILINGNENDGSNFMRDVCAAYVNPPPPCASIV